jgi:hypothetical protein
MTSPPAEQVRRKRRSGDETRALMLRAGIDLAFNYASEESDAVVSSVLAHIRLTDVAARASQIAGPGSSITTGAIYQLWSSQGAFQADLLLHAISDASHPAGDSTVELGLKALASGATPQQALVRAVNNDYTIARENPAVWVDFSSYLVASHPRVRDALRASYANLADSMEHFYELILRLDGRELLPGIEIINFSASITAVVEGFILRRRVEPHRVPDAEEWKDGPRAEGESLPAVAALGVYLALSRPIEAL